MKKWTDYKNVLLVKPKFPVSNRNLNHKDFFPIGLLKIASYLKDNGVNVKLFYLEDELLSLDFNPDLILVTSLFTYWAKHVKEAIDYCRKNFPNAEIIVGGIYASLMPEDCKRVTGCDEVFVGVCDEAEGYQPDYSMVDVDFQIIHASRGCIRKCPACVAYEIEPEFTYKKSIKNEIIKRKVVFYDNNLLANPFIKNILRELIKLKKNRTILNCESQSGFDGRILRLKPELGLMLKKARFINPKIAWDGDYSEFNDIKKQIDILTDSGYRNKEISVFMLFNHDINFEEMEKKRIKCWQWNVQVSDSRYIPLDQNYDNYNPYIKKIQTNEDYYIHPEWSDKLVKAFKSNVRKQNICVRQHARFYSRDIEKKRIPKEKVNKYKKMEFDEAQKHIKDAWNPNIIHKPIDN